MDSCPFYSADVCHATTPQPQISRRSNRLDVTRSCLQFPARQTFICVECYRRTSDEIHWPFDLRATGSLSSSSIQSSPLPDFKDLASATTNDLRVFDKHSPFTINVRAPSLIIAHSHNDTLLRVKQ